MKKFLLLIGLLLLSATVLAAQNISEKTLSNGLRVVVKPVGSVPVAMVQLWYHVGSVDEPTAEGGVSHFLEHLMFRGTKHYADGEFDRLISEYGGSSNAFTSKDNTVYFAGVPVQALPEVFKLEADRMQYLQLTPGVFAKEKQVVMEERRSRTEDDPAMVLYEQFERVAYPISPYGNPIIGWMPILRHLTLAQVSGWYHTWYVPNNAVLVVVGDVQPDNVFKLAQHIFGGIEAKPLPPRVQYALPPELGLKTVDVHAHANVPTIMVGYHVPVLKTASEPWQPYALQVLSALLADGPTSLLQQQLVLQKQVLAGVSASYPLLARQNSLLMFSLYPAQGVAVDTALTAFRNALNSVVTSPVSAEQLTLVKTTLVADYTYGQDSLMAQAGLLGKLASNGLPLNLAEEYAQHIEAVTAAQVQQVAALYLTSKNETVGELMPEEGRS